MIEFIDICDYVRAFIEQPKNRKTPIYELCNSKNELIKLGTIKYNCKWRKYCFYPIDETVFDSQCLRSIVDFMNTLNNERRYRKYLQKYSQNSQ